MKSDSVIRRFLIICLLNVVWSVIIVLMLSSGSPVYAKAGITPTAAVAASLNTNPKSASPPASSVPDAQPLSPPYCECVEYACYYYCLPVLGGDYPTANSLVEPQRSGGLWMTRQGFSQVSSPQPGDFVVLHHSPAAYGYNGTDPAVDNMVSLAGHIGIVMGFSGGGTWTIDMFSAKEKRCVVVLDNYAPHHGKEIREQADALEAVGIELFYLPPYSPELNLIEPLWRHIKHEQMPVRSHKTADELETAVKMALGESAKTLHVLQPLRLATVPAPTTHAVVSVPTHSAICLSDAA